MEQKDFEKQTEATLSDDTLDTISGGGERASGKVRAFCPYCGFPHQVEYFGQSGHSEKYRCPTGGDFYKMATVDEFQCTEYFDSNKRRILVKPM